MSRLIVVRHAQASFGAANYDQLSELGYEQSRCLGAHWAQRGTSFSRIFSGPCTRHRQTYESALEAAEAAGQWPAMEIADGLDEYPAFDVMTYAQEHLRTDPKVGALLTAFESSGGSNEGSFRRLFAHVTGMWIRGEFTVPDIESWSEFRERVEGAFSHIISTSERGETVVVFTSGGPAAVAAGMPLGLDGLRVMELIWALHNGAMVELLYSKGRVALSSFNRVPHLSQERLLTFR